MNELTKLTLTAIIGVITKELVTWLIGHIKSKKVGSKLKSVLDKKVPKNLFNIFSDVVLILVNSWFLYESVVDPSPLTRGAVFIIALSVGFILFWVRELSLDIRKYRINPLEKRMQELLIEKKVVEVLSKILKQSNTLRESLSNRDTDALSSSTNITKEKETT